MQPYTSLLHVAQQTSDILTYREDYGTNALQSYIHSTYVHCLINGHKT